MAARKKSSRAGWVATLVWIVLLVLIVCLWFLIRGVSKDSVEPGDFADRIRFLAARHGASEGDIGADESITKVAGVFVRTWRITLPEPGAVANLVVDLEAEAAGWRAGVSERQLAPDDVARIWLEFGVEAFDLHLIVDQPLPESTVTPPPPIRPTATPRPTPLPHRRGRLAVILDDGGQTMDLVAAAAALPEAVAVSVLPFLPYSAQTAGEIHRAGHEVWLHLPMEPEGTENPGPGAILLSLSEADIRTTVRSAINNIPHLVGVNQHMGSRASADLRAMTWVMQEISARDLGFIDSRTTVKTMAEAAARSQGVPCGRRHIFLDNQRSRQAIIAALDDAVYRARTEGEIIAIGHLTPLTVQTLADELPGLSQRGADLVAPSKLLDPPLP